MLSRKGFLDKTPDGLRRMTEKHKLGVARALEAALEYYKKHRPENPICFLADSSIQMAKHVLDYYPTDRSCQTCDHMYAGECRHWKKGKIPDEVFERGCDSHQEHGTPF